VASSWFSLDLSVPHQEEHDVRNPKELKQSQYREQLPHLLGKDLAVHGERTRSNLCRKCLTYRNKLQIDRATQRRNPYF
jgi:hypothetical protein